MRFVFESGEYKALGAGLIWELGPFNLVTGPNGSGKSQLLQLMRRATEARGGHGRRPAPEPNAYFDAQIQSNEVIHLETTHEFGQPKPVTVESASNVIRGLVERQDWRSASHARPIVEDAIEEAMKAFGQPRNQLSTEAVIRFVRPEAHLIDVGVHPTQITHALVNYMFGDYLFTLEHPATATAHDHKNPADLLDDELRSGGLRLTVERPASILGGFNLAFRSEETNALVHYSDLSKGERTLVTIALWSLFLKLRGTAPKLFLLDEPDSHLHTARIPWLVDSVRRFASAVSGTAVIATHRPETILAARDGELFELSDSRVGRVDRRAALTTLTAGLVEVMPALRIVFVEDDEDVRFYEAVKRILAKLCPNIAVSVTLKFETPSVRFEEAKRSTGGGRAVVRNTVAKLCEAGLDNIVRGLVDLDAGAGEDHYAVRTLDRYSIENYLCDPVAIVAALLDSGLPVSDLGLKVENVGGEATLRTRASVQESADAVVRVILPHDAGDERATIEYVGGGAVEVPAQWLSMRGKDLLKALQGVHPSGRTKLAHPTLLKAMERTEVVPTDLRDLFRWLCEPSVKKPGSGADAPTDDAVPRSSATARDADAGSAAGRLP